MYNPILEVYNLFLNTIWSDFRNNNYVNTNLGKILIYSIAAARSLSELDLEVSFIQSRLFSQNVIEN